MSLSDLSMAGAAEFFRQWCLLCRRDEFTKTDVQNHRLLMHAGGSSGHSGAYALDISLGPTIGAVGGRDWDVRVRPAEEALEEEEQAKRAGKSKAEGAKADQRREKVIAHLERNPEGATTRSLRDLISLRDAKLEEFLAFLSDDGLIEQIEIKTRGGTRPGYRMARRDVDPDIIERSFPLIEATAVK